MKYAILAITALAVVLATAVTLAYGAPAVRAQSSLPTPGNFTVVNGPSPGEAIGSWNAVSGAAYYRVGWVATDDVLQAFADETDIFNHYAYADISGATSYTVTGLKPGKEYYFTIASLRERFGRSGSADVVALTLNDDTSACPTDGGGGPGGTPTPTPPVRGGDYDADNDGLIEIRTLAQLDAIRYDLDGDGQADQDEEDDAYAAAFPGAAAGMGCPGDGCTGYELAADLGDPSALSPVNWEPIGYWNSDSDNAFFNATFDGNGHTVTNLSISRQNRSHVGLFGVTGTDSVIKGVGLLYVNAIGYSTVGGLVGWNNGTVTTSYVAGSVTGSGYLTGGLVGDNRGTVTASYATGSVAGGNLTGGLVGDNRGTVTASYATGSVAGGNFTGGLVGSNGGTVAASYATGSVRGSGHVGGLVGDNRGTVAASYAITGSVRGSSRVGGLAGNNSATVTASYATGSVAGRRDTGGLVGRSESGVVTTSYWNTETSGLSVSAAGVGLTTAELQSPTGATGIYATWNPGWWDFGTSTQYPVLKVQGLSVATQRGGTAGGEIPASTPSTADRAALVALYNATDGPNWTNNDGWLSDAPIGEWHGVGTGDDGRVTVLDLSSNGLTETLPAELGDLSGLTWLDLDYNGLSGEIPAGLGDLSGLTVLRLGSNELTGAIPAELGRLSNLVILGLGNNQLTGSIPSQLGNLSGLVRLSMWNNQLTGPIPTELGRLSELERLNLSANGLTGGIPSQLGDLNKLTVLELGSNRLSGEIPTQIGQLTNLLRLSLSKNQLTGEIPSELGMLTDLVELHLWENQLSGPIPVELGGLTDLKALNLGNNQLSGNIPAGLADLSSLTHLHLNGNQLVGPVPAQLGSLSQLTRLYLRGNRLSGTIPAEMGRLSNLEVLDLSHNQLTGAIPSDLGNQDSVANTREFDSRLMGMTAAQPGRAFQAREIAYTGIGRQFNANASPQPAGLSALRVLNLSHNRLTGAVPGALGRLTGLKRLYLNNNRLTGALPAAVGGLRLQARHVDKNQQDVDNCGAVSPEKGVENDRAALQYLYTATDGRGFLSGSSGDPKWRKGEGKDKDKYYYGWEQTFEGKDNFPLGSWYGVTTNRHGRVIKLELGGNGLKDDTAKWHENLADLRKDNTTVSSNDPLYCLMVLDLSDNDLFGDIGAMLSNLNLAGELEVRLSGNQFINWIGDDLESVKVEMGDGYLTDAIEERVNSVEAADVAKVGLKILRYTSGSRVVRAIAKTGGRVGLLGTVLSNETITDALLTLVFEDGEAACKSLLSSVKDGDAICKYGISHWGHCSLLITATDRSQYPADCPSTS